MRVLAGQWSKEEKIWTDDSYRQMLKTPESVLVRRRRMPLRFISTLLTISVCTHVCHVIVCDMLKLIEMWFGSIDKRVFSCRIAKLHVTHKIWNWKLVLFVLPPFPSGFTVEFRRQHKASIVIHAVCNSISATTISYIYLHQIVYSYTHVWYDKNKDSWLNSDFWLVFREPGYPWLFLTHGPRPFLVVSPFKRVS